VYHEGGGGAIKKEIANKITEEIRLDLLDYLKSDGPGGQQIIAAFMAEFEKLSYRSPPDDPTNLKNHMGFLENHIRGTWDESISISDEGEISIGIGKDSILGFDLDKSKLKHSPKEVVWTVYLIRGIAGKFAFVNPSMYQKKHGKAMPGQYAGGFLIGNWAWYREGWDRVLGDFGSYEHPASGAAPIPFFKNVLRKIDIQGIVDGALKTMNLEIEE